VVDAGWTDVPADAARRLIARVRGS
jgi:hypothetical protein